MDQLPANPFNHRGAIRDPAAFFGRADELRRACNLLGGGQSVSVVGPRRIGKSSLLMQLAAPPVLARHGVDASRILSVYADCAAWAGAEPGRICRRLRQLLARRYTEQFADSLPEQRSDDEFSGLEELVENLARRDLLPVLLLDEFEHLGANPRLDAAFFSALRSLAGAYGLVFVTVSARPLLDLHFARQETVSSPFFNFFAQLRLRLLEVAAASELLSTLSARGGLPFDAELCRELLDFAGPHPLMLQIAGYHAFEALRAGYQEPAAIRRQMQAGFQEEASSHYRYFWNVLSPDHQRLLALLPLLAEQDTPGVQYLRDAALLSSTATARVHSQAFADFVARQHLPDVVQTAPIIIDCAQGIVLLHDRQLALFPSELRLLRALVEHANQLLSIAELVHLVWQGSEAQYADQFRTTLRTLRQKLGADAGRIVNVRGRGYMFASK